MTTHDRDKVIAAAKEAGFAEWENTDSPEFLALIAEFYTIAFEAGRQAEREECVGIYKSLLNLYLDRGYPEQQLALLLAAIDDFIAAIRARSTK